MDSAHALSVLLVTDGVFPIAVGGMQRHSAALIRYLPEHAKLSVVHPHPPGVLDLGAGVREFPVPWPAFRGPGHYLRSLRAYSHDVADIIGKSESEFDVVYVQGFSAWAYLAKRRIPCVVNPHGLEMYQPGGWLPTLKSLPFRALCRFHIRHANRVVSLGGRLSSMLRRAGASAEQIVERPNAVDVSQVDRVEAGVGNEDRVPGTLLFVGRLVENKGLPVLLDAMTRLRTPATLLVAGDGPLRSLVERAGARVRYLGSLDDQSLFAWFRKVSAFVLPTLGEGMPTVLLEAMASRTPVIASDVGAVAAIFDHSMGRLVRPGAAADLAAAIDDVLSLSDSDRAMMGAAARRRVETSFDWPIVARAIAGDLRAAVAEFRGAASRH